MKKILFDHQIFSMQKIGGISRYFAELLKFNPQALISLLYTDNVYLQEECFKKYKLLPKYPNYKEKGLINRMLKNNNYNISVKILKENNFDVFHPTYYDSYFLKYLKNKPFVLTVYDMVHELFPYYYPSKKRRKSKEISPKIDLILKANKVIAISENTKNDILRFCPQVDENKIRIIHLGYSFSQQNDNEKAIFPKENFILFTGERIRYKNFDTFAQAVAPLLIKYDLRLICTGAPFSDDEKENLKKLGVFDRVSSEFVCEEKLSELYSKAICFVFPSLYEGFGLPILEAFSQNCPCLLSNASCFPEIAQNAAQYFEPKSVDDMRNAIEKVICSPTLQNEMILKGKTVLQKYSWEKCAQEHAKLYEEIS
ncbi:MAG: glycosyltransferase family 4 protein [Chitinivibrionia bacterium]|nr:glycosyltransferase family 4 protein [Chitinivibrionia bacterium]